MVNVWSVIIAYGIFLLYLGARTSKPKNINELNIADGNMNWVLSAFGIAATWIWAPALFVASERSYLFGFWGVAWFIIPNIFTLMFFSYLSTKAVQRVGDEHTLSELMGNIYKSKRVKKIYNFELLALSAFSVAVQLLAGGAVVSYISNINFGVATIFFALIALIYTWSGGFKANITTDFVQMVIMIIAVVVALVYVLPDATMDFSGVKGISTSFFSKDNWTLFLTYGLTTTIGLIAGPVGDQSYWQIAFSMQKKNIKKSFLLSALIFGIVPVGMAMVGFIAKGSGFEATNSAYVGLEFIMSKTPEFVFILFILAIVSGLASTLDSAMCAVGSITSNFGKRKGIKEARIGMIAVAILGIIIANIPNISVFWLFLFYGVLRSSVLVPTISTMLMKEKPSESAIYHGTLYAILFGLPVYAVGAIQKIQVLSITGTLLTVLIPIFFIAKERWRVR